MEHEALCLAASLFVAAPAVAAQPDGGHYVWVPAGATVVMLPATQATRVDFPVAHMIAQQAGDDGSHVRRHGYADGNGDARP